MELTKVKAEDIEKGDYIGAEAGRVFGFTVDSIERDGDTIALSGDGYGAEFDVGETVEVKRDVDPKDLTSSRLDPDWHDGTTRRFTHNPELDGEIAEGEVVRISHISGVGDVLLTVTGFGDEWDDAAEGVCYCYGDVDFGPAIDRWSEQAPDEMTDEVAQTVRGNLPEGLSDAEAHSIIRGLRG